MAVFWKHIKGTGNAKTNNDGLWSWIEWAIPTVSDNDVVDTKRTMEWAPQIKCDFGNQGEPEVNLGYIITSDNLNQEIYEPICLNTIDLNNSQGHLIFKGSDSTQFHGYLQLKADSTWDDNVDTGYSLETTHVGKFVNRGQFDNTGDIYNKGYFRNVGNIDVVKDGSNEVAVSIAGKCQAEYFNATSDKRAKENIYPLMASALDIINAVQVYTFNYKNSDKTTIGLIAQDMLQYNLGGVTFVSNPDATGEDGDNTDFDIDALVDGEGPEGEEEVGEEDDETYGEPIEAMDDDLDITPDNGEEGYVSLEDEDEDEEN